MLKFGIEQEYFVFEQDKCPSIATIQALLKSLCLDGFTVGSVDDHNQPVSMQAKTPHGTVTVKSDFCTHIIEVAFPPLTSANEMERLYKSVYAAICKRLQKQGLRIQFGGVLENLPQDAVLGMTDTKQRQERLQHILQRPLPLEPFALPEFFATICATQIHFEVSQEVLYDLLLNLYGLEYLFPLLFSNSKSFLGKQGHCVRPLIYEHNFLSSYKACGFPALLPSSKDAYRKMVKSSEGFVRDYCFIAPTAFGTVEFRTGCSQNSIKEILQMLALRAAVLTAAKDTTLPYRDSKQIFSDVCWRGAVPLDTLKQDLGIISAYGMQISQELQEHLIPVIKRIDELVSK